MVHARSSKGAPGTLCLRTVGSGEKHRERAEISLPSYCVIGGYWFRDAGASTPLGNFTINHLAKVRIADHGLTIRYVVDMAEIPTFQVMSERSIEGNERSAPDAQWGRDEIGVIQSGLGIRADGQALALVAGIPRVSTRPGAGGLPTLYFVDELRAAFPNGGSPRTVTIKDRTYSGRIGWKDISVAPDTEPTNELRAYPNALLGSPRSISAVSITLAPNGHTLRVGYPKTSFKHPQVRRRRCGRTCSPTCSPRDSKIRLSSCSPS